MGLKVRKYYIGIVVTTSFLLVFWMVYPPTYPAHPRSVASSPHLISRRLWNEVNKSTFHHNGQRKAEEDSPLTGPETEDILIWGKNRNEDIRDRERKNEERFLNIKDDDGIPGKEFEDHLEEEEEGLREWNKDMKASVIGREAPELAELLDEKLPSKSTKTYEEAGKETKGKRYLIYRCGTGDNCSGFADRQRAIAGIYLLSLATNRTFGVIMKEPAPLQDFYVPNKVNWDINPEDLIGKSFIRIECGKENNLICNFADLNALYPQDVVYIRSKSDFLHVLGKLGQYRENLPSWALGSTIMTFGRVWTTLMRPTAILRNEVNSFLLKIAIDMRQDVKIIPKIRRTRACVTACKEIILSQEKDQSPSVDECFQVLESLKKLELRERVNFLRHTCAVQATVASPPLSLIKAATGHDYLELGLVCAQIRLGRSEAILRDPQLNRIEDVYKIWDVLRPYINVGHHLFLASDSQEVRNRAKEMFGPRVHINTDPIVHINQVKKHDNPWRGMKTALMEQLVLSTACKVLVYSNTGYGTRAAMIRHYLTSGREGFKTFLFYKGKVKFVNFNKKPPMLPLRKNL